VSKYGDIIKNARKPDSDDSGKPENQNQTKKPENQKTKTRSPEELEAVNLGVKVPKYKRQYWAGQSKMKGVSMTKVIMDALAREFGEPE
jgi:hypothetical protein